jgi:hypothetical protein
MATMENLSIKSTRMKVACRHKVSTKITKIVLTMIVKKKKMKFTNLKTIQEIVTKVKEEVTGILINR